MPTDIQNTYSDEQTYGSAAGVDSENIIDHGNATGRGPGPSRGLYLVILNRVLWEDASVAAVFLLVQADVEENPLTSTTTLASFNASTALIPAGEVIAQVALPTITQRYTQITASWTTNETTLNQISAFLTTDPQATFPGRAAVVSL